MRIIRLALFFFASAGCVGILVFVPAHVKVLNFVSGCDSSFSHYY